MAFEAAYVVVTAPATTGTSDVTISGFGVPEAVMVFGNNLGADGTTTDALMSVGAWDGTNQWSYFTWSDDNVGTSNLVTGHNTGGIVADETASGAWCAQVTATSVTDGIEVSWKNDALSRRYLFVFFKGANGATAWNYYYGMSTPDYTKTFTHNNDFTFLYHDSRSSYVSQGALSCNLLLYDGTSYNKCGLTWAGRDGQATTTNCINLNSTDCGPVLQYAASLYTITTSRPTSTQLKLDISNDHPRTNFFGLTFDLDDDEDVAIGYDYENITPPTTESYTIATGFEPGFMGFVGTRIRTIDTDRTDADASSLSFGVTDGTNGFSLGFRDADGVSPTSCDSWQDDATTLGVIEHNNDTITHDADISSFDSNGYTLYWNAALSAARYHLYWAIKNNAVTVHEASFNTSQSLSAAPTANALFEASASFSATQTSGPVLSADYAVQFNAPLVQQFGATGNSELFAQFLVANMQAAAATAQADKAADLAISHAQAAQWSADTAQSATLSTDQSMGANTAASASQSASLDAGHTLTSVSDGALDPSAQLATQQQATMQAAATANSQAVVDLGHGLAVDLLASTNLSATIAFNGVASSAFSGEIVGGTQIIEAAVSYAVQQHTVSAVTVALQGNLSIQQTTTVQLDAQTALSATSAVAHAMTMQAVVGGVIQAGLSLSSIQSVSMQGSTMLITVNTPDGRVIVIRAEDNTVRIGAEDRLIAVPGDDRTFTIH